jgi:hypothetical protein
LEIDFPFSMEAVMREVTRHAVARKSAEAVRFNYNKLQAVACIACSSAVSIGAIYWLVKTIF